MTRTGTQEARKHRIVLGAIVSLVTFGVALPITFGLLTQWLDMALNFPDLFTPDMGNLLAGGAIVIGLLWITGAYSFLVFVGKGSPVEAFGMALEPTRVLVTSGPYAYMRHPMVFGVLCVLLGVAFYLRSVSGLILMPIITFLTWIYLEHWEERHLERRFGDEYRRYRDHVRALLPSLTPYSRTSKRVSAAH